MEVFLLQQSRDHCAMVLSEAKSLMFGAASADSLSEARFLILNAVEEVNYYGNTDSIVQVYRVCVNLLRRMADKQLLLGATK
tara:strand:+ start:75 stop:320 length:246 start_codon:yes stop_codon:yes gene_type:complete